MVIVGNSQIHWTPPEIAIVPRTDPKCQPGRKPLPRPALRLAASLLVATSLLLPAARADGPSAPVMPCLFEPRASGRQAAVADRLYAVALGQARWLLGQLHPWSEDPGMRLLTESRSGEHWIRPNTGAIEGLAFLHRFGPYDAQAVGLDRQQLLQEAIVPMIRYAVTTHVTGTRPTSDGKPWGDAWQSAHWAQMLARGAWWVWDDLPQDLRDGVRRVTAHEADRIAASTPPAQLRRDTKSEENAWNSQIFSVAVLLAPDDPRRPVWEAALQKWVLSSYLRPSDARCQTVVDGRTVAEQFTGANISDDFTLENHGIVHPDYMTAFGLSLGCETDYRMSGRKSPQALFYNLAGIYENLKWFLLPDGGFVYPNGQDWQLFRNADWIRTHFLMACYAADPDAWSLGLRSLEAAERMQRRSGQGNVYLAEETFFASSHSDLFRGLAASWLTIQSADPIHDEPAERLGVRRLDPAGIILHRTATSIHTFAWGARTMAQCVPFRLDRIVSPHESSGIGSVRLQGAKSPLPVRTRSVDVQSTAEGFSADLTVEHGEGQITARLHFRSQADGTWTIRERLVAEKAVKTDEVATGLIGILNNPNWIYEQGRRTIALDGRATEVAALSGRTISGRGSRSIEVDSAMMIESAQPLSAFYQAAAEPVRSRATDQLWLNYIGEPAEWQPGQVISDWEATIRCRK